MRFDGARMINIRSLDMLGFCWCVMPRSMLNSASKRSPARRINSPLSIPDQPSACIVVASCPVRWAARSRGRFSSSRTRTGHDEIASHIKRLQRLILRNRGELVEEPVESLSAFQVVEERLNRNPSAPKNRCAAGNLWVAVDDGVRFDLHLHNDNLNFSPPPPSAKSAYRAHDKTLQRSASRAVGRKRKQRAVNSTTWLRRVRPQRGHMVFRYLCPG